MIFFLFNFFVRSIIQNMNRIIRKIPTQLKYLQPRVFFSTKIYTETHEWYLKENNNVKIGLSKEAINQMNDLVYIDDDIDYDQEFEKGDPICTIESVKAVSEIITPIDCKIIEINEELLENLEEINKNPEDPNNWILKLEEL